MPAESAVQMRTEPSASRLATARIALRTSSQAITSSTVGKKWLSRLSTKIRPASVVAPPATIANGRTSRRSDPATSSISPAAISSAPIMSDDIRLPAGSRIAPALSRMIAIPATRSARARLRSLIPD